MVRYLIHRPVAVLVIFVAFCTIGVIVSQLLPVSMLPDIKIPEITVRVAQDNTNALDLERNIVAPLRIQLMQVAGLEDIQSETHDNVSVIRLKFAFGINIDYAFIEVNDKVDLAMSRMPREVRRPTIIKASATDLPVFLLNISLKDEMMNRHPHRFAELSEFSTMVISRRLEQLPQVAMVDISGTSSPELYIIPDESLLLSQNLTYDHLKHALEQNNISVGGITVREGLLQYTLVFKNELRTIEDVKNILLKSGNKIIPLREIAEVGIRQREMRGMYLSQGKPAISMGLIKSHDARINEMRDEVEKLVQQLVLDYPEIEFEISQDQTFLLNYSIGNLKQNLLQGCLLAILIMFLFLRDYRSPFLIAVSLPVTLIISLLFFYFFNISINIISLSGLILGVGMMIDNSIIVIDNIIQHRERGLVLTDAIIKGTNEVVAPMISATLTTCAIFIPLIFLSGMAGALFYDQALAIAIGLGTSLIVSVVLTPVLFNLAHTRKNEKQNNNQKRRLLVINLENIYHRGFNLVFRNQLLTIALMLLLILSGIALFIRIDKRQLPDLPQDETVCYIDWNQPIHADENRKRTESLLAEVQNLVVHSNAFIGEQQFMLNRSIDLSPSETKIYFKTDSPEALSKLKESFGQAMATHYPDIAYSFNNPDNPLMQVFSVQEEQLIVKIAKGRTDLPELDTIKIIAGKLNVALPGIESTIPVRLQCVITLQPEIMTIYNVSVNQIFTSLKVALNNHNIGALKSDDRMMPIIIGAKPKTLFDIISGTFVRNSEGVNIPLRALVTVDFIDDYRILYGGVEGLYVPLPLPVTFSETPFAMNQVKEVMKDHADIEASFAGSFFRNRKLLSEMSVILVISVILLYFILAAQFESLTIPWIILIEIPLALSFAILVLYFAGSSLNIMSMIGLVVMGGIIINDSILKIDTINRLHRSGMELMDALREGGHRRLKPIIMTSLTTIIAILPQMFGSDTGAKLQLPLSLAIISGLSIGTLISLYVIPLAYYHLMKAENYFRNLLKQKKHRP